MAMKIKATGQNNGQIRCFIARFTINQVIVNNIVVENVEADIEPANEAVIYRGESHAEMEPLVLTDGSRHRPGLSDLALELTAASAGFRRSLPPGVRQALADLVRAMNCYY